MKFKIVAIIPARGGSIRVKNKNIKKFYNKPLISWTIDAALKSKLIDQVYVTSNDNKILQISKDCLAKVIKRPKKLSNDIIMPDMAIKHAYLKIKENFDYVVTLQPTSPLRTTEDINGAINTIIKKKADSLLSVFKAHPFLWKKTGSFYAPINYSYNKRPRSQDIHEYQENGAIYITKPKILINNNNRLGGKIAIYPLNFWKSIDIDTLEDFKFSEALKKVK